MDLLVQVGINLLAIGVAYGLLAGKVAAFEKQSQQLRDDLLATKRELAAEILRLRDKYHELAPLEPTLQQFIQLMRERKT